MFVRFTVALLCLTISWTAAACLIFEETHEDVPPHLLGALNSALKTFGVLSDAPTVGKRIGDGDLYVSIEEVVGAPEPGVSRVRRIDCSYQDSWACRDLFWRALDFRGNRVALNSDITPAEGREFLAQIEASVGTSGISSMRATPLNQSDLQRIHSLSRGGADVFANLDVDQGCGEYLLFRRQCTDGQCSLRYIGYIYGV
jgi:hypothetical protein